MANKEVSSETLKGEPAKAAPPAAPPPAPKEPAKEAPKAKADDAPPAAPAAEVPQDGPGRYRVTMGEHSGEFEARDKNEAWALFCDSISQWPSPKRTDRKIDRVG